MTAVIGIIGRPSDANYLPAGTFDLSTLDRLDAGAFAIRYDPDRVRLNWTVVQRVRCTRPVLCAAFADIAPAVEYARAGFARQARGETLPLSRR